LITVWSHLILAPEFFSVEFEALIRYSDVMMDVGFGQGSTDEPVVIGVGVEEYPAPGGFAAEETILVESGVVLEGYEGHGGRSCQPDPESCPSTASTRPHEEPAHMVDFR